MGGWKSCSLALMATSGISGRPRQVEPGTWATLNTPPHAGMNSTPFAARNADGRIEAFCTGSDGALWHIWQTAPGKGWGTWSSFGRPIPTVELDPKDAPCVESNPHGRLEVFAKGTDGALWHIYQTAPNGTWSSWASLGKPPTTSSTSLGSSTNADGRMEVFTVGEDGGLWHIWQYTPGGSWSGWNSLGKPASGLGAFMPLTVSRNFDGRLEVFVKGSDGAFYHVWQHTPGGSWGGWFDFGSPPAAPTDFGAVAPNKDGRLDFLVSAANGLWHTWQITPGGPWGGWFSLGNPAGTQISSPCVIANADGRLEAFLTTTGGALWHTWQVLPGGVPWVPIPTIASVTPNWGPADGGTHLTLTGAGFTGATAVTFGSTVISEFTIVTDTQITTSSPAGSGTVDITVTTPAGPSATSSVDQFTYTTPMPTITGLKPNSGSSSGGTTVTITGSGFTGAWNVIFGQPPASNFTVVSDSQITATSPAGSGTIDVTVTTSSGTSATGSADQFTYLTPPPTITGISPASGPTTGGTSVTITGTGFTGATSVLFGQTASSSFTVVSDTQITVTSPSANSTGTVDVTVTTPGGTSATGTADQFTY